MNASDRKTAASLADRLSKLSEEFDEIRSGIQDLAEAERDKFDNMSEGLQQGERGQAIEQAADTLEEVQGELENIDLESLAAQLMEL